MNINHTFQYLQMGLPERINRKKLFGDFEGALQDMESYLLTPDLPDAMRHCLTTEAEMLRRLPSDFPYTREEALAVARKEVPDFSEEEFDQLERKFRIRWIYQNGESGILTGSLKIYAGPIRRWPDGPEKRPLLEMDGIFRKR